MRQVNMKIEFVLAFFIMLATSLYSQDGILIPAKYNNVWGAMDSTHNEVIPFSYDKVSFYSFGYYLVESNGKKGLYNGKGKMILSTVYDAIKPLGNLRFQVFLDGKTGILTSSDKVIIPIEFDKIVANKSRETYIVAKGGKYSLFSNNGLELTDVESDNISFYAEEYFLVRKGNKFAVTKDYKSINSIKYYDDVVKEEDFFIVRNDGEYGVLDRRCNEIIKVKFDNIKAIGRDYLAVSRGENFAFFDKKGNKLSRYSFQKPFYLFDNNICWTLKDETWYRYDLKNRKGEELEVSKILSLDKNYYRILKNNYVEIVDKTEETHFAQKYQDIIPLNDSLFKVKLDRKWGVVNKFDESVLPIQYNEIIFKSDYGETIPYDSRMNTVSNTEDIKNYPPLFVVRNLDKYGVYRLDGKEIIPIIYDEVGVSIKESMIWTKLKVLYGAYNREGEQILENRYNSIDWNEGQKMFTIFEGKTLFVADTLANFTVLKDLKKLDWTSKSSLFFYEVNELKGLRNIDGSIVVPSKYKTLYDLDEDYFVGINNADVFILNKNGKRLFDKSITNFEVLNVENQKMFIVQKDKLYGVADTDGNTIIPFEFSKITYDKSHKVFKVEVRGSFKGFVSAKGEQYF